MRFWFLFFKCILIHHIFWLYAARQSLSFLDYHFLHDKAQHPINLLYAGQINKFLNSNNNNDDGSAQNSRLFTCKQCMKQFKHAGSLAQHVRMHTNIENFRCPICMKLFSRIYDMKTHVKCRHPEFLNSINSSSVPQWPNIIFKCLDTYWAYSI